MHLLFHIGAISICRTETILRSLTHAKINFRLSMASFDFQLCRFILRVILLSVRNSSNNKPSSTRLEMLSPARGSPFQNNKYVIDLSRINRELRSVIQEDALGQLFACSFLWFHSHESGSRQHIQGKILPELHWSPPCLIWVSRNTYQINSAVSAICSIRPTETLVI